MPEENRFIQDCIHFSHEVKDGTHLTEAAFHVEEQQMAIAVEELIGKLNAYKRPVVFLGDGVPVYRQMLEEGLEVPYSFAPSYMNRQRAAVSRSTWYCVLLCRKI